MSGPLQTTAMKVGAASFSYPQGSAVSVASAGYLIDANIYAAGFRAGELIHNSFSYHFVPAGSMMETGAHALGCTRVQLVIRSKDTLTSPQQAAANELFARRRSGEPIAYLTGEREFFGLSFAVTPDVLIPRHETELLVEFALARAPDGAGVLDLGTGSGAIAVAVAAARPDLSVTACDRSDAALAIAAHNNARLAQSRVRLVNSDWYAALDALRFAVIVANPPYIAARDPHLDQGDLRFEPRGALTDEADGLAAIRKIVTDAPRHLGAPGWLALEHGWDQAQAVRDLLNARGFVEVASRRDLAGIERMSCGRWPRAD